MCGMGDESCTGSVPPCDEPVHVLHLYRGHPDSTLHFQSHDNRYRGNPDHCHDNGRLWFGSQIAFGRGSRVQCQRHDRLGHHLAHLHRQGNEGRVGNLCTHDECARDVHLHRGCAVHLLHLELSEDSIRRLQCHRDEPGGLRIGCGDVLSDRCWLQCDGSGAHCHAANDVHGDRNQGRVGFLRPGIHRARRFHFCRSAAVGIVHHQ